MNLFVLTPEEKRVVAFVMLMILVGTCVKEYRKRHPIPPVPLEVQKHPWMRKLPPLPSPSATITPRASDDIPLTTPRAKRPRKPHKPNLTTPKEQPETDSATQPETQPLP